MRSKSRYTGLRWKIGLAVAVLPSVVPIAAGTASATSSAPAWEPDPSAAAPYGTVLFYDAEGNQVTSGTNLTNPFFYAVASTAADAGAIKANLAYYLPVNGQNPQTWSGASESGPTTFNPATGLPAGTPADVAQYAPTHPVIKTSTNNITVFANNFPSSTTDTTSSYYQTIAVRITDSRQPSGTYWQSDIAYNESSSPITVDGTTVPANGWAEVFPLVTPTTTTLAVSPPGSQNAGQSVTLTATTTMGNAGTVNFFDNGTLVNSTPASVNTTNGQATYTYTPAGGSHSYTASFSPTLGDETGADTASATIVDGSTSSAVAYSVTAPPTTTTVTSSTSAATVGSSVTFTATVSPVPDGGTVKFTDTAGAISSSTCTAVAVDTSTGKATCTVTEKSAGTDDVTAQFSGSTLFQGSTSTAFAQTVNPAATTTTLSSSASSVGTNVMVTYTATVSPVPDGGTVAFTDGSGNPATTSCASKAVNSSGQATCTVMYANQGVYTVGATYSGDSNYNGSTSSNVTETVNTATTTVLTADHNPAVTGQAVTFTATVNPTPDGGTVAFKSGSATISGCSAVSVNTTTGVATCTTSFTAGSDSVTAVYSGDTLFATSTSAAVNETVNPAQTTTSVSSSLPGGSVTGQAVTYTATVAVTAPGAGSPMGTVAFKSNGVTLTGCSAAALVGGHATCESTPAAAGQLSITAVYSGSTGFSGSTSTALTQTVSKAATTTTVASSENPGFVGKSVTYTATVAVTAPGSGTPTGTVAFSDGGTAISSCASQAVSGGKATCTVTYSTTGAHSITATYNGDANFSASPASSALSETIDPAVAPSAPTDLTATAGDAKVSLSWKAPASAGTFPVSGYNVFVGTVAGAEATTPVNSSPISGTAYTVTGLTNNTKYFFTVEAVSSAGSSAASNEASATPKKSAGYIVVGRDGGVFAFGVPFKGSLGGIKLAAPIVGVAQTPDKGGYWLVARDGGVFAFGDAQYYGSLGGVALAAPINTIVATADGKGYWLFGADGGVFAFGDARYHGSLGGYRLNGPIVAGAVTPDGGGYWMVGADGGIFAFGDAKFEGSLGGIHLSGLIVGIAPTADGRGYTLVGADGGVFGFGDAHYAGSLGGVPLAQPVIGIIPTSDGLGYTLVAADGGVFAFGDATFQGSLGGDGVTDIVGAA